MGSTSSQQQAASKRPRPAGRGAKPPYLTPLDVTQFMQASGLSHAELGELLGNHENAVRAMESRGGSQVMALAFSAILFNLQPWKPRRRKPS